MPKVEINRMPKILGRVLTLITTEAHPRTVNAFMERVRRSMTGRLLRHRRAELPSHIPETWHFSESLVYVPKQEGRTGGYIVTLYTPVGRMGRTVRRSPSLIATAIDKGREGYSAYPFKGIPIFKGRKEPVAFRTRVGRSIPVSYKLPSVAENIPYLKEKYRNEFRDAVRRAIRLG